MRVAFSIFGGSGWTGGINYLENLLSALSAHAGGTVQAVLFVGHDTDPITLTRLRPYLSEPPIVNSLWNKAYVARMARAACAFGIQRDVLAERAFRKARIDLVFQHYAWYGYWFPLPTLSWIADFQHRRLPSMFSRSRYLWRDIGYRTLSRCATRILVSSEDARRDCERFYPNSIGRTEVLPFAIRLDRTVFDSDLQEIRVRYGLPAKFFFLPNQLWKHKNHLAVIDAIKLIKSRGGRVVVVATGNPMDARHPRHPGSLLRHVKESNLGERFIFLGMVPHQHILPLMRISAGVINPSLCEGWSTTVEEAKAVGAPLLLSDLAIHREQAARGAVFFDPNDPTDIALALEQEWERQIPGPRKESEIEAVIRLENRRLEFAQQFAVIARRTVEATRREV